jgi:dethiobiotin synthetase
VTLAVVDTGTGVGKTAVTTGLIGLLRDGDVDAVAVKPYQSGHPPDDDAGDSVAERTDSGELERRADAPVTPFSRCRWTKIRPPPSAAPESTALRASFRRAYPEGVRLEDVHSDDELAD